MAPGSRRGKPGLASRLNINGRSQGQSPADGDVGMAEASGTGPDRRVRSGRGGRGAVNSRNKTPYSHTPAGPGRPKSLAALGGRANKPTVLSEQKDIKGAVESLRTLVASRWNAGAGLLNLENMAADPVFSNTKLRPPTEKGAPRAASAALWKVASEICPNLQSLSLASNNLSTLVDLSPAALIRYLPTLKNLSLQNNSLRQYADLNPLSTVVGTITGSKPGLGELQELILTGNPLTERESSKSTQDYQSEVRRRFPSLRMLDQVPIDQTIPVPIPRAKSATEAPSIPIAGRAKRLRDSASSTLASVKRTKVVLPIQAIGPFADSDTSRNAMSQFLIKFFNSFDNDRAQLAFAYTPEATFSMSVNTTVSERARRLQHLTPEAISKQKQLTWATYLGSAYESTSNNKNVENMSRNFLRNKNAQRREETLHVGPEKISSLFAKLPKTSHPLSDAHKFVVDTWQQPGFGEPYPDLLVVVAHGEFAEHPSMASRSFDRTLVLAPASPGSAAANNGWPCMIISDLLILRNWTNPGVWNVQPQAVAQPAPTTSLAGYPDLTEPQKAMMSELHNQTRLNAQFCYQCLSETGWALEAALQAFQAAKGSIPPEAFV